MSVLNNTINNLPLIASACEYFDKATGAAWKIRSRLTNMLVWVANSVIYAEGQDSPEQLFRARTVLATLRCWVKSMSAAGLGRLNEDSELATGADTSKMFNSAFGLAPDLSRESIKRTLGLEKVPDFHAEAIRVAQLKCRQTRSATKFAEHYKTALMSLESLRAERLANVGRIAELLTNNTFVVNEEDADYMRSFQGFDIRGNSMVSDEVFYNEDAVERQADQIEEVVATSIASMYELCDAQQKAAITTRKIDTLGAHMSAIKTMMGVVGLTQKYVDKYNAALDEQLKAEETKLNLEQAPLNKELEKQAEALQAKLSEPKSNVMEEEHITRDMLRQNPNTQFLFGDNLIERGLGGQAGEMRDEPNAIGIPTKRAPSMLDSSFFTDNEFEDNKIAIDKAFDKIDLTRPVVIPANGLGTGRAQLDTRAPKTYAYLQQRLEELRELPTSVPKANPNKPSKKAQRVRAFKDIGALMAA
jgi:hypothetical protein